MATKALIHSIGALVEQALVETKIPNTFALARDPKGYVLVIQDWVPSAAVEKMLVAAIRRATKTALRGTVLTVRFSR